MSGNCATLRSKCARHLDFSKSCNETRSSGRVTVLDALQSSFLELMESPHTTPSSATVRRALSRLPLLSKTTGSVGTTTASVPEAYLNVLDVAAVRFRDCCLLPKAPPSGADTGRSPESTVSEEECTCNSDICMNEPMAGVSRSTRCRGPLGSAQASKRGSRRPRHECAAVVQSTHSLDAPFLAALTTAWLSGVDGAGRVEGLRRPPSPTRAPLSDGRARQDAGRNELGATPWQGATRKPSVTWLVTAGTFCKSLAGRTFRGSRRAFGAPLTSSASFAGRGGKAHALRPVGVLRGPAESDVRPRRVSRHLLTVVNAALAHVVVCGSRRPRERQWARFRLHGFDEFEKFR
jgi:hypothetical protein